MAVFEDEQDHVVFMRLLQTATQQFGVAVHAFSLMKTHYHLLVTPAAKTALPDTMRQLGIRYGLYFNRKYDRFGGLWAGRYRGIPIGDELYWLTCLRYVELNPELAHVVESPGDYRWSSYRFHALDEPTNWLADHAVYTALGPTLDVRRAAYRALSLEPLREEDLTRHRLAREDVPATCGASVPPVVPT
jgi:putative transposase